MRTVEYRENPYYGADRSGAEEGLIERFGEETAKRAKAYHAIFPEYSETPLVSLPNLAEKLGIGALFVKDESFRFGLDAFKALGGSYAIGQIVAARLGKRLADLTYSELISEETKRKIEGLTFVTATDGNHGRGVAWAANRLGVKSVVYMPKGSAKERLDHIQKLGADASITELSYDDAVRLAAKDAEEKGWILVQDTAWPGYEDVPRWIMEGYTTMAYEAALALQGGAPTHVFLQAGVGAMAGAVSAFLTSYYRARGEKEPRIYVVEPDRAACFYRTATAADGAIHPVTEEMNTIMAGLACGEPCTIGWEILKRVASGFFTVTEEVAAEGMRVLGAPLARSFSQGEASGERSADPRIISGESGAATAGLVLELLRKDSYRALREEIGLNADARVLLISTEGATDRANYERIVWDGAYSNAAL